MKENFYKKIEEIFSKNKINLTEIQKEKFYNYYLLLVEWNQKFNLTAITEMEDVIVKHFLDSAIGYNLFNENSKIVDIGAGAGFPSIPLKIMRPDLEFLLVDSVNKKLIFLDEVIKNLSLTKIATIHSRAEDLANKIDKRESYNYCVARAVAQLNTLAEYCLPFVKIGGSMVAYKSNEIEEELNQSKKAIEILGGKIVEVKTFAVADYERKIVEIKKINSTPKKYPRGGNKPRLMPL